MIEWYDRQGIPICDTAEVERLLRDMSYKRVARSKVISAADPAKSFDVSTVWLGLDHSFGGGIPLIFETMVFAEGDSMDLDCRRYATEEQARGGHVETVAVVASTLDDPIVMDVEEECS